MEQFRKGTYEKLREVYKAAKKLKRFNSKELSRELKITGKSNKPPLELLVYLKILEEDKGKQRTYYNFIQEEGIVI